MSLGVSAIGQTDDAYFQNNHDRGGYVWLDYGEDGNVVQMMRAWRQAASDPAP